jgi:hypothetical protein
MDHLCKSHRQGTDPPHGQMDRLSKVSETGGHDMLLSVEGNVLFGVGTFCHFIGTLCAVLCFRRDDTRAKKMNIILLCSFPCLECGGLASNRPTVSLCGPLLNTTLTNTACSYVNVWFHTCRKGKAKLTSQELTALSWGVSRLFKGVLTLRAIMLACHR